MKSESVGRGTRFDFSSTYVPDTACLNRINKESIANSCYYSNYLLYEKMPLMDWSWHPTRNWKFIPNASEPVTWFQSASLGTKIALSTLTLLALFQTIFFLSLLVMNSMSLAQQRSTKHFQFKLPVFAMGFAGIFLAKLNMVLWGAVLYPG